MGSNGFNESPESAFREQRRSMVEHQLRSRDIHDARVLAAMQSVPRHEFVGREQWAQAYSDHPVGIAEQQTTSQPYIIASMLQSAEIQESDRVLEVGAGSGYQTALLAVLAAQVIAIERYPSLAEQARATLKRLGYENVIIIAGDGSLGAPQYAPFDAILVSAAAPQVPPALVQQLAIGGRLVIPVGDSSQQVLQLVRKHCDSSITAHSLEGCRFVPLIGEQGFAA
ncbi:MAG TPA: protein-L-isoaspartate(D-aspartate) O-methyltransferase [Terriglobales bacterium]|nr:protein-L-isoaspartate(D-aspartate) O-methyltransferase [Terriglobales bacterium]